VFQRRLDELTSPSQSRCPNSTRRGPDFPRAKRVKSRVPSRLPAETEQGRAGQRRVTLTTRLSGPLSSKWLHQPGQLITGAFYSDGPQAGVRPVTGRGGKNCAPILNFFSRPGGKESVFPAGKVSRRKRGGLASTSRRILPSRETQPSSLPRRTPSRRDRVSMRVETTCEIPEAVQLLPVMIIFLR
jgi:hypothetical protein